MAFNKFKHYLSGITKSQAIIAILIIVAVIEGIALLVSHSRSKADTEILPDAARVERVDGDVGIASALDQQKLEDQNWKEAKRNTPLSTGDRIYARQGSRTSVAFTGKNYARLDSGSVLDVLSLTDRRTQLALRNGSAIFDVGDLGNDDFYEVATPCGAVDFHEPGLYQVGYGDDGYAWVSVLSGLAQAIGLGGYGEINRGEILRFSGLSPTQVFLSRLSPEDAGSICDDYYGYRYPGVYDGRYRSYDAYLDDPFYYTNHSRYVSYDYVAEDIPGAYDLDTYGDWTDIDGYGHCWVPRVDADWAPYRNGYWDTDEIWGPTWVADEPWGWAPYHYGRWGCTSNHQWFWVPDAARTYPVYAPALVAFVPIAQTNQIGWVPLAPGEPYIPRYYDANFQPRYLASADEVRRFTDTRRTFANVSIPQAVTVVPVQDFTRETRQNTVAAVNPQFINQAQPVIDPYSIQNVRAAALRGGNDRAQFKMDKAFRQQVLDRQVMTSTAPIAIPGQADVSKSMLVATVPEAQKKHKMKLKVGEQVATAAPPNGLPRIAPQVNGSGKAPAVVQQPGQSGWQTPQNDQMSRREMKQMAREQRQQGNSQWMSPGQTQPQMNNPNPSSEQMSRQERKAQRRLERQQQAAGATQSPQIFQQPQAQQREQRRAQKAAEQQHWMLNQQQQTASAGDARRAEKQQRKAQRQLENQQQMNGVIQQQQRQAAMQQAERQQRKAERRAERQMQPPAQQVFRQPQEQMQQRELRRAQRAAEQRQIMIQQQQAAAQMAERQQRKAQRQQERQQQMNMEVQQQRQIERQQRQQQMNAVIQQQQRQAAMQQAERQQRKAERRAERQMQPPPQVYRPQPQPQQQVNPGRNAAPNKAQRQAEKAQRKAGRGN